MTMLLYVERKHMGKKTKNSRILFAISALVVLCLPAFSHETKYSTNNEVNNFEMINSRTQSITINGEKFMLSVGNNGFHHGLFIFNIYKRNGLLYNRVNKSPYYIFSSNINPNESSKFIFSKIILQNRHSFKTSDSTFIRQ
jgi:hypothetical protein